jgi:aryl-alcohol dehydrogenase-like predicted oxidoreductase
MMAESRGVLACTTVAFGKPVCRLGLASRGGCDLKADDVLYAVEGGINFLNWPGNADNPDGPDAVSDAVASLGSRRDEIVVCVQFGARSAEEAAVELRTVLTTLQSDYVDVLTFYYVEHPDEWQRLTAPDGALDYCRRARQDGIVRRLGVTSHQRPLAAQMARSGLLDAVMIRYNAAHRGAEKDVFPVTDALHLPVIAYTALRWGALPQATPDDPPGFKAPAAQQWYRFVLHSPSVAVVLAAPNDRSELEQDLGVLDAEPLSVAEYAVLAEHGERVRRHAGTFW